MLVAEFGLFWVLAGETNANILEPRKGCTAHKGMR